MFISTPYTRNYSRRYNSVLYVTRVDGSEFITLTETKAHLKVDFTDDDDYITSLIPVARQMIENYTGLALIPTAVTAILRNELPGIDLPLLPYVSTLVVTDLNNDDEVITSSDYTLTGNNLLQQTSGLITVTYTAGYTISTLPAALKMAVLHQVTYLYENRGDGKISESAKDLAKPYRRSTWLI
jgi:uncharacterized phiE125 gp8 family phage protein